MSTHCFKNYANSKLDLALDFMRLKPPKIHCSFVTHYPNLWLITQKFKEMKTWEMFQKFEG